MYDSVDEVTDLAADRPEGMLMHAAAEQADGTILIVDVWESAAQMDAFERERLFPAFAAAERPLDEPPTRLEAFQLIRS